MVALCIYLRNFTNTVQWKILEIQEYYAPDKAFKLVFSCHSSVSYLFPLLNVRRMDATEKRFMFGWTLWPASCMVKPWLTTWLTTVARISSEVMALLLALPLPPLPPLPPHPPPRPLTLTSVSLISSTFHVAIHCSPNQELTCGPYIAKALIPNCTTALEMEVLPFGMTVCSLSEHKEILHWWIGLGSWHMSYSLRSLCHKFQFLGVNNWEKR